MRKQREIPVQGPPRVSVFLFDEALTMELQVVVTSRVGDDVDADADVDVDSLQKQIKVVSRRIYSGLQNHNLVQLGPSSM